MKKNIDNGGEATELELEGGYNESRIYELGFHLDPELAVEEAKKIYQKLRDVVTGAGTLVAEGEPQKVQLAYTISKSENHARRDYDNAYFAWIAYEADQAGHQAVVEAAGTEARLIRFLDIRTERDAAVHAAEMHEIYARAAREEVEEPVEDAAEAELDAALKDAGV